MGNFFKALASAIQLLIVFLLIGMYYDALVNSFKEKKYIKFILLSLPLIFTIYYLQHFWLHGHPPKMFNDPDIMYDNCTCK